MTCKIRWIALALLVALAGCAVRPPPAAVPATAPQPPATGRAYDIDPHESLLTILVFRGGLLASAGHNHVIASHALTGTIRVPDPATPLQTTFEIHLPVDELTIDEPALREALHREDFPPDVPEAAREGTRKNMLGEALLDAAHHPQIVLRSAGLQASTGPGGEDAGGGEVLATVQASVRGEEHPIRTAVHYRLQGDELQAYGQLALKQSDLGLRPFSAFLGALTVQDEMQVRFELHAHAAGSPPQAGGE
jgi:hypothetical protein